MTHSTDDGSEIHEAGPGRRMRLRYQARCRVCAAFLPPGTTAWYAAETKTVTCDACSVAAQTAGTTDLPAPPSAQTPNPDAVWGQTAAAGDMPLDVAATHAAAPLDAVVGEAGGSARREHERRQRQRENRVRAAHPRLGGVILALTDDPSSTRAWATGARGEERLAARLDAAAGDRLRLLHDRRIPRSRANIDHLAVTPSGVYVIDAKRYTGRPDLRVEGGLLRPRTEKLVVGRRDCTQLVDGVHAQVDVVRRLLATSHPQADVHGVLCFVEADWPLIGGDFTTRGVYVAWPKKLQKRLQTVGPLSADEVAAIHRTLAGALPPA